VPSHNVSVFFWTIAGFCALLSAFLLWRFLQLARRNRFVADTPIVRIRSAAQGYVHVEGRASPPPDASPRSPLSNRMCVWWDYQISRAYRNDRGKTEWSIVEQATSVAPFILSDSDGQCLVGPVGAVVTPTLRQTWYGASARPESGPPEERTLFFTSEHEYRYTEKLIMPGTRLSVLGELRSQSDAAQIDDQVRQLLARWKNDPALLRRKFDHDHNGRIDAEEWEEARAAARTEVQDAFLHSPIERTSVVAKTTHGEPFLIAPFDEVQLLRRGKRFAALSLMGSATFLCLTLWAVHRALPPSGL
jgi:E3 Ubiquitin ligase